MNHFQQQQQQQQQTHVAQQSRREKLRIPGSLHPSSPQSGNNTSDHSAGSQAGAGGAPDQENYTGVLPGVYNDAYGFAAGSELLAAYNSSNTSSKPANGFSDIMLPPQHQHQHQQQQQGQFSNLNLLAKNWSSTLGGNPLSIAGGAGNTNQSSSMAATLLSTLQGRGDSYLTAGQSEAMQLFQLTGYTPGPGGYSDPSTPGGGGSMVLISPGSGSSSVTQGSQQQQHQHFIGIPLTPDGGSGSGIGSGGGGFASAGRGTFGSGTWRNGGDEFLFLPSSEATNAAQRKALGEAGGPGMNQIAAAPGDLQDYTAALRQQQQQQSSLSSMLGQQLQHQPGPQQRLEIDNSPHPGVAGYQSLSLSLSNQNAQLQASLEHHPHHHQSGLGSPDAKRAQQQQQQVKDLSHFRSSPRDSMSAGGSYPGQASAGKLYFEGGAAVGVGVGVGQASAVSSSFNFVSGSRYLRAAQQLLDEVCSVGRGGSLKGSKSKGGSQGTAGGATTSPTAVTSSIHGAKEGGTGENSVKSEITMGSSAVAAGAGGATSPGAAGGPATAVVSSVAPSTTGENKANVAVLTPEERQEYEGKKSKLLAMLQEVDRRYRQYYDQMQIVITSFDAVAGAGAATPYTALALQAMSRYFRCLRDAITTQIQSTCKALGEEDVTKSITSRPLTSRLRFIDQQIRQQRAYQQYGMLQQHAWRPQRGLPERSVSILRAWLFEHFLHPYPKDADKMMLARQTGLTRGQVSNWFINARVRLWKPMVEEMYQEEIKEQELGVASARLAVDPEEKHHHHEGIGGEVMMSESRSEHHLVDKMQLDHHPHHHHQSSSYSDYGGLMMRKTPDPQMFGESDSQVKKTRLGIHDPIGAAGGLDPVAAAVAAAGMEVDLKSDSAGGGICIAPERHYVHEQYVHPDNFQAAVAVAARYGGGPAGFGSSPGAGGYHHQGPGPGSGGGGVSLTLGLRNCDNLQQQIHQSFLQHQQQQQQQNFLAPRNHHHHHHHHHHQMDAGAHELCNVYENAGGGGGGGGGGGLNAGEQEGIDYQGRKQQQIESHLLHDFVA